MYDWDRNNGGNVQVKDCTMINNMCMDGRQNKIFLEMSEDVYTKYLWLKHCFFLHLIFGVLWKLYNDVWFDKGMSSIKNISN